MRSEYVFAAVKEISNRFLLCRMASAGARRLHQGSTQPGETINKSLKLIATAEPVQQEPASVPVNPPSLASAATTGSS
jgi:DNA-directed RNA polymerase subunit K/omega